MGPNMNTIKMTYGTKIVLNTCFSFSLKLTNRILEVYKYPLKKKKPVKKNGANHQLKEC